MKKYILIIFIILILMLANFCSQNMIRPETFTEKIIEEYKSENYENVIELYPATLSKLLGELQINYIEKHPDLLADRAYEYTLRIIEVYKITIDSYEKLKDIDNTIIMLFKLIYYCDNGFFIKHHRSLGTDIKKEAYFKLKGLFKRKMLNTYFINYELVKIQRYINSPFYKEDQKKLEDALKEIRKFRAAKGTFR